MAKKDSNYWYKEMQKWGSEATRLMNAIEVLMKMTPPKSWPKDRQDKFLRDRKKRIDRNDKKYQDAKKKAQVAGYKMRQARAAENRNKNK